jgi:ATP-dependent protease HslVU (ClpYQ) peptidase subunit
MTTLAVKIDRSKGEIQIATDNQLTTNSSANEGNGYALDWSLSDGMKLFELANGWVIAMAGSGGEMNCFRSAAESQDFSKPLSVRQFLKNCYAEYVQDPGYCHDPLSMFIVADSKVFQVLDRYGIIQINNYMALGSGTPWAMAAMHLGKSAAEAVVCASVFDLFTDDRVSSKVIATPKEPSSDSLVRSCATSNAQVEVMRVDEIEYVSMAQLQSAQSHQLPLNNRAV